MATEVTLQSVIPGKLDLRQIYVNIEAGEVNTDYQVPLMDKAAFEGQPIGLLLALTYSDDSPRAYQPREYDRIEVLRIQPVTNASADVTFKSIGDDGSTATHSSPAIPITSPAIHPVDSQVPIFTTAAGDRLAVASDAAAAFLLTVRVKGRFDA